MSAASINPSLRYWYGSSIQDFLTADVDKVLAELTKGSTFSVLPTQRDAWLAQIDILRGQIKGLKGGIFLEFSIPRMGRRIDTILLIGPSVFVVEFKVGETLFDPS